MGLPAESQSRPIKVLHVITGLGVGGAESMLASLAQAPTRNLVQSVVSLIPGGFHAARLRAGGVSVTELSVNRPTRAAAEILRLAKIIRAERPDVIQGWMYHGNLAALAALSLSGRRATPLAWGIRCSDRSATLEPWTLRAVIRAGAPLTRFSDVLIANSQAGLDYHLLRGYRNGHAVVIRNGIDVDRFRPDPQMRREVRLRLGLRTEDLVLAHVARVHPMKDHATFVDVVRSLPNVRALAIGAGTEALPDIPNLKRLGRSSEISDLLTASDVVVSTSAYGEGFSNAIGEGMAAALVPIATDVGDARVIIGDTGTVVPIRSPSHLREAVEAVEALPRAEVASRGERARERIATRFGLKTAIAEFTQLYVDMVRSSREGGT